MKYEYKIGESLAGVNGMEVLAYVVVRNVGVEYAMMIEWAGRHSSSNRTDQLSWSDGDVVVIYAINYFDINRFITRWLT